MSLPSLEEVLPHAPPMILLDAVESFDDDAATCTVTLRADSPFVEDGEAPAAVMIEYMAQCVAAWAGCKGRRRGDPVRVGYLLGAREFVLHVDALRAGDTLTVTARHVWGDEIVGSFECSVTRAGTLLGRALLSVYQGDPGAMPR